MGVLALGLMVWPYTVDDAYVLARYASHLRSGQGYVMNPEGPSTDGATGPLWLVLMWGGVTTAKVVGLLAAAGAAAMATLAVHRTRGAWSAAGTALFAGTSSTLGIWAVAGLEAGAAALAVTVVALPAAGLWTVRWWVVGLAAAAVPWLRPEAVPVTWAAVAFLWLRDGREGSRAAVVAASGVLTVVWFRWAAFGTALPLSALAKPPDVGHGMAYGGRAALAAVGPGALVLMAVALLGEARTRAQGVLTSESWKGRGSAWVCGSLVGLHWVAVVAAGGDWMPGYRLVAPAVPMVAVLVGMGMTSLAFKRRYAMGMLAFALAVPLADAWIQLPEARQAGRLRQEVARPLAAWLGQRYGHVALVDAGYLPWVGGFRVLDLAGITDPRVGLAPGGHLDKRVHVGLLATASPDAILLHSSTPPIVDDAGRIQAMTGFPVEQRVASMPWVRSHYGVVRIVQYAPDYHYVVLARRSDGPARDRATTGRL